MGQRAGTPSAGAKPPTNPAISRLAGPSGSVPRTTERSSKVPKPRGRVMQQENGSDSERKRMRTAPTEGGMGVSNAAARPTSGCSHRTRMASELLPPADPEPPPQPHSIGPSNADSASGRNTVLFDIAGTLGWQTHQPSGRGSRDARTRQHDFPAAQSHTHPPRPDSWLGGGGWQG